MPCPHALWFSRCWCFLNLGPRALEMLQAPRYLNPALDLVTPPGRWTTSTPLSHGCRYHPVLVHFVESFFKCCSRNATLPWVKALDPPKERVEPTILPVTAILEFPHSTGRLYCCCYKINALMWRITTPRHTKHLVYTFPGGLRREMSRQLLHSLLSPFLCMGMVTLVYQSFGALTEHHATWHTRVSQRTPRFKALRISDRILS